MFLALKMTELWQFEIKSVTGHTGHLLHSNLIANQLKACRGQIDKYEVKLEVRYI